MFALRGKVLNVRNATKSKILENEEIKNLMAITGLQLGVNVKREDLYFQKIVIASDFDCIEGTAKVLTESGPKAIKDVEYNDMLLTHNGHYKPVVNIVCKESNEYISLKINGKSIKFTHNHRLFVMRGGKIIESTVSEITKDDLVLIKK